MSQIITTIRLRQRRTRLITRFSIRDQHHFRPTSIRGSLNRTIPIRRINTRRLTRTLNQRIVTGVHRARSHQCPSRTTHYNRRHHLKSTPTMSITSGDTNFRPLSASISTMEIVPRIISRHMRRNRNPIANTITSHILLNMLSRYEIVAISRQHHNRHQIFRASRYP